MLLLLLILLLLLFFGNVFYYEKSVGRENKFIIIAFFRRIYAFKYFIPKVISAKSSITNQKLLRSANLFLYLFYITFILFILFAALQKV